MKAALYARVSTENQDLEDQIEELEKWAEYQEYDYDLYAEKVSGKDDDREEFQELMDKLLTTDEYDVVAVTKIDRWARTTRKVLENIDRVEDAGASFVTVNQIIDTRKDQGQMGKLMTDMLAVFADFERRQIKERMEKGYRKAHEEGRVGRPKKLSDEKIDEAVEKYEKGWSYDSIHKWLKGQEIEVSYDTVRQNIKERRDKDGN